jgi:hypothetical protein
MTRAQARDVRKYKAPPMRRQPLHMAVKARHGLSAPDDGSTAARLASAGATGPRSQ